MFVDTWYVNVYVCSTVYNVYFEKLWTLSLLSAEPFAIRLKKNFFFGGAFTLTLSLQTGKAQDYKHKSELFNNNIAHAQAYAYMFQLNILFYKW